MHAMLFVVYFRSCRKFKIIIGYLYLFLYCFLNILAINEADYVSVEKVNVRNIKKEKDDDAPSQSFSSKKSKSKVEEDNKNSKSSKSAPSKSSKKEPVSSKKETFSSKKSSDTKPAKKEKEKEKEKEEDELKGLEEMYYGIMDGIEEYYEEFPYKNEKKEEDENDIIIYATQIECPICDTATTFDSNEKLQTHLVSHLNIDGKDHNLQCLFCLEKMDTETVLTKHNNIMHPEETKSSNSASYRCLICQQRFNSLNFLTSHLQNKHSMLELPYNCQACGYKTSSHRDAVRHFYDDHKHQNFLQCPYCLDVS